MRNGVVKNLGFNKMNGNVTVIHNSRHVLFSTNITLLHGRDFINYEW